MWDYLETNALIVDRSSILSVLSLNKNQSQSNIPSTHYPSQLPPYSYPPYPLHLSPQVFFRDTNYFTVTPDLVSTFLKHDMTDTLTYKSITRDCDDFAQILMTHFHLSFQTSLLEMYQDNTIPNRTLPRIPVIPLFGIAYGTYIDPNYPSNIDIYHAFNVYYHDEPPTWYCVEPQNDTVQSCS